MSKVYIGTSGWHYKHWLGGVFYPEGMRASEMFDFYARYFDTVEINNSFYRLPTATTFDNWRDASPRNFCYAVKASRFITHMKKLKDPQSSSEKFFDVADRLGRKLGPILFQLPASLKVDCERLERFMRMLPPRRKYAFEFRDASWYDAKVFRLLGEYDVSLCLADHHLAPAPWVATAGHVYVRGHGPEGRYRDNYPDATLRTWSRRIRGWQRQQRRVYAYFDNDQKSAAPKDARRLMELLQSGTRSRFPDRRVANLDLRP